MVDWHNTLEVGGDAPGPNTTGLNKLLSEADVHLLSFVGTGKRKKQVDMDMATL